MTLCTFKIILATAAPSS